MVDLKTKRLRLEPLKKSHAAILFEPLNDSLIYKYIPDEPLTREALHARYAVLERGRSPDGRELWLNWVAFSNDTNAPIGTVQATLAKDGFASIAYIIFPAFWRKGFGREMVSCIVTYLFEQHKITSLIAEIDTRNSSSIKLVESLGFTRDKTTQNADFFKGASSDEHTYVVRHPAQSKSTLITG